MEFFYELTCVKNEKKDVLFLDQEKSSQANKKGLNAQLGFGKEKSVELPRGFDSVGKLFQWI